MANDVYVQYYNGIPATRNLFDCNIGFRARGHRIIPFEAFTEGPQESEILRNITREDILCAGIPIFRKTLAFLGIEYTGVDTYPAELRSFMGRTVHRTTFGQVRDIYSPESKPFFVKPVKQKLFTGFVVNGPMDMLKAIHVDDNEPVWVGDVVGFASEYRVYVNAGKRTYYPDGILACSNYEGNPLVFPDPATITKIVSTYNKTSPIAYAVDVGVVRRGKKLHTVVIEVNDATSLGNYGVPSPIYAEMLETRWREIVGE